MVRKDRCCVGICNNDRRYQDKREIKSHVQVLKWHWFPKDKAKPKWWQTRVNKERENFVASDESRMCSNHFDWKPTEKHPNPTLLLTIQDNKQWVLVFVALFYFRPENLTSHQPYSSVHCLRERLWYNKRLFHFTSLLFLLAFLYA